MLGSFDKIRFRVYDKSDEELQSVGARNLAQRGIGRPRGADADAVSFNNDEAAARYYLREVLSRDARPGLRALAAKNQPQAVPDARVIKRHRLPLTRTRLVQFDQTKDSVPIFGSRLTVEMDENRRLISITGEAAQVKGVCSMPSLGPQDALERIAAFSGLEPNSLQDRNVQPPELRFFHDGEGRLWHLAYFFRNVPAAPKGFIESAMNREGQGHGFGVSPRVRDPLLNYLVDAHDGAVLFYYSATPLLGVAVECNGIDELNSSCLFWGRQIAGGFEMADPLRSIKTYDHQLKDLDKDPLPTEPAKAATATFRNTAAVSAHVNASRVYDFYNSVLMRDGIDDKGMGLDSVVNCTCAAAQAPPEWFNAQWYQNRMYYGQAKDANNQLRSFSRFLDIIGHELTHGVTEKTSGLIYKDQSGALNESFSDIFGVIIYNWYNAGPDSSTDTWNWEIGSGLGARGLPLRDMSNPARTGDPDHMNSYLITPYDSGGVHTNSNIHNKAAYNVLTAKDEHGNAVFTPKEVAVLYYYCMDRVSPMATFSAALETLTDVASVYYSGDEAKHRTKISYIREAYQKVGIA